MLHMEEITRAAPAHVPERNFEDEKLPASGRTRLKRVIRLIAALVVLIALVWVGSHWLRGRPPPLQGASEQQTVSVATIGIRDIRVIVPALGTVTPLATVTVQTQINGQIVRVGFTEGQTVKKGDFLAQIDPRPYELLKAQFEGQLAHDQGLLEQAKQNLTRYQRLADQNSIARQQYEDQVYIVKQYEGTVKLDQAQVAQQALNVEYCHIVSPITGYIGLRLVDPGNYVQTNNNTGIAVVAQLQPISVVFPIPEDYVSEVRKQMRAGDTLTVLAYDRSNTSELSTGKLTAIDSQIDTTTGTVKLRAEFDNSDDKLFPNQFVNVRLLVRTLHNVVAAPIAAVQTGAPGNFVYLINHDNIVTVRPIKIGSTDGDLTQILSGLAPGDHVVIDGADQLHEGVRVKLSH